MLRLTLFEPPVLFAQTVYMLLVELTVGVPESMPLSNTIPSGSSG